MLKEVFLEGLDDRLQKNSLLWLMVVLLDDGSPVTRSRAMWDYGRDRVERGCNNPTGGGFGVLGSWLVRNSLKQERDHRDCRGF